MTVGVEFGSYMIKIEDKVFRLQIWDTVGQESFRSITKIFYRGSHAVILGYSVAEKQTFDSLSEWLREIRMQCAPDVMICLAGNKADLSDQYKQVSREKALAFKAEHDLSYFCETSAKSGDNVERLFCDISKFLYLKHRESIENTGPGSTIGRSDQSNSMLTAEYRGGSIATDHSGGFFGQQPNSAQLQAPVPQKKGCCN